ncbi:hypothetical protein KAR91_45570 [Candidatus Pacearchaeota archaeon]|nr:hypothetical protein [Candidatus Pacearchaeota archaeon]
MNNSSKTLVQFNNAKEIANKIVRGDVNPHEGCDQISAICKSLDYCDELIEFFHLSHLQTGHEYLGFKKENLRQGIIEESKRVIKDP